MSGEGNSTRSRRRMNADNSHNSGYKSSKRDGYALRKAEKTPLYSQTVSLSVIFNGRHPRQPELESRTFFFKVTQIVKGILPGPASSYV